MNVTQETDREHSQLFLVRLWTEQGSEGSDESKGEGEGSDSRIEWCGKLQHVVSGALCYFDGLSALPEALEKMIAQETVPLIPDPATPSE
jgi:hypothetical protein